MIKSKPNCNRLRCNHNLSQCNYNQIATNLLGYDLPEMPRDIFNLTATNSLWCDWLKLCRKLFQLNRNIFQLHRAEFRHKRPNINMIYFGGLSDRFPQPSIAKRHRQSNAVGLADVLSNFPSSHGEVSMQSWLVTWYHVVVSIYQCAFCTDVTILVRWKTRNCFRLADKSQLFARVNPLVASPYELARLYALDKNVTLTKKCTWLLAILSLY